jgi:phospholipase/carboxylesterase
MPTLDGPRWGPQAGGAPTQLVVLAHGLGADGHDLIDLGPAWGHALPHAVFAAPNGPQPNDQMPHGRQWFEVGDREPARMLAGVAVAAEALSGFVEAELARLGLPPDAVALMGFSQGAMVSLHAGLRRRVPPRAILAFSGALIDPALPPASRRPPVLLVHGEADTVVPPQRSREAERVLIAAGVRVESMYEQNLGHTIGPAGISVGALFLQRGFAETAHEVPPPSPGS